MFPNQSEFGSMTESKWRRFDQKPKHDEEKSERDGRGEDKGIEST